MTEEPPPAIKRAMQLMQSPVNQVPIPAILYAAWMCNKYGMCGEVFMSAYCVYAQIAEGLSVEDDALYGIDEKIRAEWDEVQRDFIMINLPDGRIQVVRKNA
jgi:hypothetical protein